MKIFPVAEAVTALTPQSTYERYADGRPRVSDDLLERMKLVTTEEAWGVLRRHGYNNQFEGEWTRTHPNTILVGRALTCMMIPHRPDLHDVVAAQGEAEGRIGGQNSWVIDQLQPGDVLVVDLFGKVRDGTFIGDNLATSIRTRTKAGAVIHGGIRDYAGISELTDVGFFCRGLDPTAIANVTLAAVNMPVRIGNATAMPGDVVLGTPTGIIFIPPHLAQEVVERSEDIRVRDEFGKLRLTQGKYTPGEIDRTWSEAIEADYQGWLKERDEFMLDRNRVVASLESKRELFTGYDAEIAAEQKRLADSFDAFRSQSQAELAAAIGASGEEWPGALPTDDIDATDGMRAAFGKAWNNHQEARAWAFDILRERPAIAVDGSQITPTKDFSMPVGAVQVGWFVNEHKPAAEGTQNYVKDVQFEVLAPDELGDDDDSDAEGGFPNWRVNQQRFVLECAKLCALMEEYSVRPEAERPLCFFDGSFIISFAGQLRESRAKVYIEAVDRLLHCSRKTRTPLVGFVDSSYSRDVVTLVNLLYPQAQISRSGDASLFGRILTAWGDRSPLFLCARRDSLNLDPSRATKAPFYKDVAFVYVNLVSDRAPARLEMPCWILDAGRADEIIDRVRAESVVGVGYPYAIETADALAVISQQDRERFYRILQDFLEQSGIQLSTARKMRSKQQRR